ncbi:MAG: ribonuclease R [Alphaproteobacteria bacterium]|nr:MAG: ribonuclease R [Alphaproteobacteria bacterium]
MSEDSSRRRKAAPFPTPEQVLAFLRDQPGKVGKREIARAFHISGDDRLRLKALLRELEASGQVPHKVPRSKPERAALPEVAVLEIVRVNPDEGGLVGVPVGWEDERRPPSIHVATSPGAAAGLGDRVLCRLTRTGPRHYLGTPIKVLPRRTDTTVGLFIRHPGRPGEIARIRPSNRREREEYVVRIGDEGDAEDGQIVRVELLAGGAGLRRARVLEVIGDQRDPRVFSLVAIAAANIPTVFSPEALAEAEAARPVTLGDRTDLRDLPLITIDGADARDFDDAVFAEQDGDGWHLVVAIADVAHYVTPDSALDRAAYERGNSVYFPDRVVPMLPEALSNELCSLKPGVERACLAVHLWIDAEGTKRGHRFVRGLMKSTARLTYEQVQAAIDGTPEDLTAPLVEPLLRPLYGAYNALQRARDRRGTLDLDLPERKVAIASTGTVAGIQPRARLDSHKLIEEFMILANVAAAETIERCGLPCLYRVHDEPSQEKTEALREFLGTLNLNLVKGQQLRPSHITRLLASVEESPVRQLVHETVLRSMAQAIYSPDNHGHFGLALARYAHFTSPIRRYADLIVHRALIRGLALGDGALPKHQGLAAMEEIGEHVSTTERRAAEAERDAIDRYVTAFMAASIGGRFVGRVSGVTSFGLFVTLEDTGATGLIPMRGLPEDFYHHDDGRQRLVGERRGRAFTLGDTLEVRLADADIVTGSLSFEYLSGGTMADAEGRRGARMEAQMRGRSGRPQRRFGPRR